MARKQKNQEPVDKLKWETAGELGLEQDLEQSGDELSVVEAGRIGGNMTRKLVETGERALEEEDAAEMQKALEDRGTGVLPVPEQDL